MKHKWVILLSAPMLAAGSFVVACGDDDSGATPGPDGGPDTTTPQPPPPGPGDDDAGDPDAGIQDAALDVTDELTFTTLTAFKPPPTDYELPEGVITVGGNPIVSLAPEGRLVQVLADGGYSTFAQFLPSQDALTTGLAADATNIYIAVAPNPFGAAPAPPPGIYKVAIATGGGIAPPNPTATPVNNTPAMWGFPNGLVLEGNTLWVSDSSGKIMRIADPAGATPEVTEWIASPDLVGDRNKCNTGNFFDVGVNGLAADASYLYGVNHDQGIFFRIKREQDGGPGMVEKLYENCDFSGADGIAVDRDGSILVANNLKHRIDRVTIAGTTATFKTLAAGPPLDSPATPFIDGTGAARRLLVTSSAFGRGFNEDASVQATAKPALLSAPMP